MNTNTVNNNYPIRVGINGFGRIGKCLMRAIYSPNSRWKNIIQVVQINSRNITAEDAAYAYKYDTVHRIAANEKIHYISDNTNELLVIDDHKIFITSEEDISKINWTLNNVDIVLECTGKFNTAEYAKMHFNHKKNTNPVINTINNKPYFGVIGVIVSAPCDGADATIICGVNDNIIENLHINTYQKHTNVDINTDKKHTNVDINTDKKHTNADINTYQKHTNVDINTHEKHINVDINTYQKHTNADINTHEKHINADINTYQKHTNADINTHEKHTNVDINTHEKHTNVDINTYQKHINADINTDNNFDTISSKKSVNLLYNKLDNQSEIVISAGSCTTNCLLPIISVIKNSYGIKNGFMTTIHSYTNDQSLVDKKHLDKRRGRAGACSIIPTTTGVNKIIKYIFPEMEGKIFGSSLRVPTNNISLVDFVFTPDKKIKNINDLNNLFIKYSEQYPEIMGINQDQTVSSDFIGDNRSCIIDLTQNCLIDDGNLCRVVGWYDNEYAFAQRMIDICIKIIYIYLN
ncbi:type I glyceraldehyde-3-phosphate dehydrogenase [Lyticum sinuosum]|uniref:Glyceraldehyde-3-phosphate dehydrogenase n=1 Tax=Lyticum sinuosum TaxID=1332059 RepID=A0AAE5AHD1_9RICK|nr:glyceraldehyde 3-phosphate dehydrogenase NAD-binding domain-containing protein [Lyticum sinuosum]MDZ5761430.1 Glyceraldehyde-3-phosphate dehydrogenase [Lyticum sinuosum]